MAAGWDPLAHLPQGALLTTAREAGLMAAFAANNYQPLTHEQIAAVCGPDLPFPATIKNDRPNDDRPAITGFRS